MEEVEVKFLNIDPEDIQTRLKKIGAEKVFDRLYRQRIFDYPDLRLNRIGAWIRLRDEGDKITLAYKQRVNNSGQQNDQSMEEVEVVVSDFERTALLMEKVGFKEKFYEEKKRIRYLLERIEFDIDHCPGLEPYLEIEASTWPDIDRVIAKLGLNPKDKKIFSAHQIYQLKGIDEHDYSAITFAGMVKKG